MALSISKTMRGSVLLTGGVGFLGSVCLQQLLSQTEVKYVYLLVRGKKGLTAQQRVQHLLSGPLFHQLHQQVPEGGPNIFSKVKVVSGDITQPDLGLSEADRAQLLSDVDTIIHSAASLTLDAHIHDALKNNYLGTKYLLGLASQMPRLRCFVYVSTYYVNNFKPYNTPVPEEVHYPTLQLAGDPHELKYCALADLLLRLPKNTAASEVAGIMGRLNFTSTYAFSKLLTEQLIDDPSTLPGVSKAIVRPSLIASMAGQPYPGYISGYAGAPGYTLAYGMGFFHDIRSVAFASDAIVDIIPVDTTSALVIGAAAAAIAHGPYHHGHARVYHAASAASYPETAPRFFAEMRAFWVANPPPFKLPFARYLSFTGRHTPTTESVKQGTRITRAKVWLAAKLLQLAGQKRKARTLLIGFKAFCVQNDPRYARSIVSCVNNARKLQHSLVPAEREVWRCVWEEGGGSNWSSYTATALTGLRFMALKLPPSEVKGVSHNFIPKQGLADPSLMETWLNEPVSSSSSSSSSSRAGSAAATSAAAGEVMVGCVQCGMQTRTVSTDSIGSSAAAGSSCSSVVTPQQSSSSSSSSGSSRSSTDSGVSGVESVGPGHEATDAVFSRGASSGIEISTTNSSTDITNNNSSNRHRWMEVVRQEEHAQVLKRTKSCGAVLVTAASYY